MSTAGLREACPGLAPNRAALAFGVDEFHLAFVADLCSERWSPRGTRRPLQQPVLASTDPFSSRPRFLEKRRTIPVFSQAIMARDFGRKQGLCHSQELT